MLEKCASCSRASRMQPRSFIRVPPAPLRTDSASDRSKAAGVSPRADRAHKREGPPLAERPFHCRDQAEIAYDLDVTTSAMRENPAHGQWSRSYDPRMAIDNETQDHLLSVVDDPHRIRMIRRNGKHRFANLRTRFGRHAQIFSDRR